MTINMQKISPMAYLKSKQINYYKTIHNKQRKLIFSIFYFTPLLTEPAKISQKVMLTIIGIIKYFTKNVIIGKYF